MNRSTKRKASKAGLPEVILLKHEETQATAQLAVAWTAQNQLALVFVEGERIIYKADALVFAQKLMELIVAEYTKLQPKVTEGN